jgi:hypothetical protein
VNALTVTQDSFTKLPNERFSLSAASQYYQPLESLKELVEYSRHRLCQPSQTECLARVASLLEATSVDFDFDTISHALTITAFWPSQTQGFSISSTSAKDRLEVGVLNIEKPQQPEELSLAGFLTVIGEHTKPKATLFSFPARHHPFDSIFSTSFITPTGLHPKLQLKISSSTRPTDERSCSLHAYLTLPRAIFADKYQLSDALFLASQNLTTIHHITTPVDLEAPAYAMSIWGSSMLVELAPPSSASDKSWTATIPLHLRYLPPANDPDGLSELEVPFPVVFWACVADEGSKFPINPFDKVNIGYDGLFGPKTMFYHLSPEGGRLTNTINVPVLDLNQSQYVEVGTASVVLIGFLWVMWRLFGVWNKHGYGSGSSEIESEKKNK